MRINVIDIESFYDTKCKPMYSLKRPKYSTIEYIRDERSQVLAAGVQRFTGGANADLFTDWCHDRPDEPSLRDYLISQDYEKCTAIFHHAFFDVAMIEYHTGLLPERVFCTYLGAYYLHGKADQRAQYKNLPGGENSLESLSQGRHGRGKLAGGDPLKKQDGKTELYGTDNYAGYMHYMRRDINLTAELADLYAPRIPALQMFMIDWAVRQFADPKLVLDPNVCQQLHDEEEERINRVCMDTGVEKSTYSSSAKFAELLESNGVAVPMKESPTVKDKWIPALAQADTGMAILKQEYKHNPGITELLDARQAVASNQLLTRAKRYYDVALTGTSWPVHVIPSGAHTNRITGSGGGGGSPLNLGKKSGLRGAIKPPVRKRILEFDYTGFELGLARWVANDLAGKAMVLSGHDPYKMTIARAMGIQEDQVDGALRQAGKILVLSCFSADTRVLTRRGWVPIVDVATTDRLWDGVEWVEHDGVVDQGNQETLQYGGVCATADHEFFTQFGKQQWKYALHDRKTITRSATPSGRTIRLDQSHWGLVPRQWSLAGARAMRALGRLWQGVPGLFEQPSQAARQWVEPPLQTVHQSHGTAPADTTVQTILGSEESLRTTERPTVQTLWRTWREVLVRVAHRSDVMVRKEAPGLAGRGDRPAEQPGKLFQTQPTIGDAGGEQHQPSNNTVYELSGTADTDGARAPRDTIPVAPDQLRHHLLPNSVRKVWDTLTRRYQASPCNDFELQTQRVYDIVNAGPRHRFTVYPGYLASNCQYGVGHETMHRSLTANPKVDREFTINECSRLVDSFRKRLHPAVAECWQQLDRFITWMHSAQTNAVPGIHRREYKDRLPKLNLPDETLVTVNGFVWPSGRHMQYKNLFLLDKDGTFEGVKDMRRGWYYRPRHPQSEPNKVYGGLMFENIAQSLAAEIMDSAQRRIEQELKHDVALQVYDSNAMVINKPATLEELKQIAREVERIATDLPWWTDGPPLAVEFKYGESYGSLQDLYLD